MRFCIISDKALFLIFLLIPFFPIGLHIFLPSQYYILTIFITQHQAILFKTSPFLNILPKPIFSSSSTNFFHSQFCFLTLYMRQHQIMFFKRLYCSFSQQVVFIIFLLTPYFFKLDCKSFLTPKITFWLYINRNSKQHFSKGLFYHFRTSSFLNIHPKPVFSS